MNASYVASMSVAGRARDGRDERRAQLRQRVADVLFASLADSDVGLDPSGRERWLAAIAAAIVDVVEQTAA